MFRIKSAIGAVALSLAAGTAGAVPVTLTKLSGLTGGTLAETAVYRADLSSLGLETILSIGIADNSSGLGGSPGQFSGFDLDAIKLSTTFCDNAACAAAASGLAAFDFVGGTLFVPGALRTPPDDLKLFGTGPGGATLDNAVATLGLFDGESTTTIPGADGFISLGDNGTIDFNLTSPVSTSGLYLYIGEVGDNGEVAASSVVVRNTPVQVSEPGSLSLAVLALLGAAAMRRRPTPRAAP